MPKRIQRRRDAGWRMPAGAIYVGRPSVYGNPYHVGVIYIPRPLGGCMNVLVRTGEDCVSLFRKYAIERLRHQPYWLDDLRGHDLACWCIPEVDVCHADVLIELANR